MIAQKNRLKKADFERIFRNGNKFYNQYCNIRYLPNGLGYCRFAIIVSNKISKKATERNTIRRRIKAIIVENLPNFSKDFDIVITVLPALSNLDYPNLKENLLNLLKKRQLLV
ncbi:MAG: ribonuclease P protein component [Patescibacteria group bacterium]